MDERRIKRLMILPEILVDMLSMNTVKWGYDVVYEGMPDDARIVALYFVH